MHTCLKFMLKILHINYLKFDNYSATKFFTSLETSLFFDGLNSLFYLSKERHTTWFGRESNKNLFMIAFSVAEFFQ